MGTDFADGRLQSTKSTQGWSCQRYLPRSHFCCETQRQGWLQYIHLWWLPVKAYVLLISIRCQDYRGVHDLRLFNWKRFCGQASAGMLPSFDTDILSNTPTANLSLTNGTRYTGILTYNWEAGCQPAPEIKWKSWNVTVNGTTTYYVNFSSPNGTESFQVGFVYNPVYIVWMGNIVYSPFSQGISTPQRITSPNATTYYAFAGITSQLFRESYSGGGVVIHPDVWVSTMKCNARMGYKVSTLTYTFSPLGSGHRYRAPSVIDFTNMYGLVASSIVLDITNGYYGTATIPAEEILSSFVYFVRLPALLAVSLMVFTCICLLAFDLITSRLRKSPVREMSFITVATATRGDWWDDQVDGLCCAPKSEMLTAPTINILV